MATNNLNFGTLETVKATPAARRLKPWDIYENITFSGFRKETMTGKKDPEKKYEILKVRFDAENGYHEESIFYPVRDEDFKRNTYKTKEGHERELPSNFERAQMLVAQILDAVCPEGLEKLRAVQKKITSFDQFVELVIKLSNPAKDKKQTNLKLSGKTDKDGNVNAVIGNFLNINNDGVLYVSDKFIGKDLEFSTYQKQQREAYLKAKPTDMSKVKNTEDVEDIKEDNSDLENMDTSDLLANLDI